MRTTGHLVLVGGTVGLEVTHLALVHLGVGVVSTVKRLVVEVHCTDRQTWHYRLGNIALQTVKHSITDSQT